MYDVQYFAAVIIAADRMRDILTLDGFVELFPDAEKHMILSILYEINYIDARWELNADMLGSHLVEFWKEK